MRRKIIAAATTAVLAGGLAAGYLASNAHASVPYGNRIEVGCATPFDVIVYTTVDLQGRPTGSVAAAHHRCSDGPVGSLQNYVRVAETPYGEIIVRLYPTRVAQGTPLDIDVVEASHYYSS
jgi:hypothetical protein